jgi:hypothetical protein
MEVGTDWDRIAELKESARASSDPLTRYNALI